VGPDWLKEADDHQRACEERADRDSADLELLAKLRADPLVDRALNELSKASGAARERGDPVQYTLNKLWALARGEP